MSLKFVVTVHRIIGIYNQVKSSKRGKIASFTFKFVPHFWRRSGSVIRVNYICIDSPDRTFKIKLAFMHLY